MAQNVKKIVTDNKKIENKVHLLDFCKDNPLSSSSFVLFRYLTNQIQPANCLNKEHAHTNNSN